MNRQYSLIAVFLIFPLFFSATAQSFSWEEAVQNKQASIDIYWFTSIPFIYQNSKGELAGIEYEMVENFKAFVKTEYGVELKLNWIEAASFGSIIEQVKNTERKNVMGTSAFSITEDRKKYLKFTDPYLPDVAVLVSSKGTSIVKNVDEINHMMKSMTAVTIKGTSYEVFLNKLKKQMNLNFDTWYIESDKNILETISKGENRFGYIDLSIYLMLIKNGGELTRQNFFTIRGAGYGFIIPARSDWDTILNEYLNNSEQKKNIANIVSNHLGNEIYQFIESLYGGEHLGTSILTKEKEFQIELIKNANLKLEKEKTFKYILLLGITASLIFVTIIFILFHNNQKSTKLLLAQKEKIEVQQESIRSKNEQLLNRNNQLTALNEEKNNLVRILAHDLRSPIGQIIVLSDVLSLAQSNIPEEDAEIIVQIKDAAKRLNQMISKILDFDALDGNTIKILKEPVRVNVLASEVVVSLRQTAAQKNIRINMTKSPDDIKVFTDHLILTQILENLISNAIKFSQPNTEVTIAVKSEQNFAILSVKDEGPGLTDEDKELLFTKYQKLSAKPTQGEASTGLGLSIVKRFVDQLQGKVWVESKYGEGCTFFVALPILNE